MVKTINKVDWWEWLEFVISKDRYDSIIQLPIYVQIKRSDWDKRELECHKNMSLWPEQWNINMVRDVDECFDCWWLSIEHLEQIHNFIFKNMNECR